MLRLIITIEHCCVRYTILEHQQRHRQQQPEKHRDVICERAGGLKSSAPKKNNGKSEQYDMKRSHYKESANTA